MREIKFRGFNRKNKQWLYGFYLQNRGAHFVCPDEFATGKSWDDYEIGPATVGQFTGLKDKNGKEIYEGDVFSLDAFCIKVIYRQDNCSFVLRKDDSSGWELPLDVPLCRDYAVIGNIHDNPELLKQ